MQSGSGFFTVVVVDVVVTVAPVLTVVVDVVDVIFVELLVGEEEEDLVVLEVVGTPVGENVALVDGNLLGLRVGEMVGEYIPVVGALELVGVSVG